MHVPIRGQWWQFKRKECLAYTKLTGCENIVAIEINKFNPHHTYLHSTHFLSLYKANCLSSVAVKKSWLSIVGKLRMTRRMYQLVALINTNIALNQSIPKKDLKTYQENNRPTCKVNISFYIHQQYDTLP